MCAITARPRSSSTRSTARPNTRMESFSRPRPRPTSATTTRNGTEPRPSDLFGVHLHQFELLLQLGDLELVDFRAVDPLGHLAERNRDPRVGQPLAITLGDIDEHALRVGQPRSRASCDTDI